jgi:hypothetical protein
VLWFEVQLLAATGWKPSWKTDTPAGKLLRSVAGASAAGAQRVKLTAPQLADARTMLWRFWDTEVGRPPRSRWLLAAVTGLDPGKSRLAIVGRTR